MGYYTGEVSTGELVLGRRRQVIMGERVTGESEGLMGVPGDGGKTRERERNERHKRKTEIERELERNGKKGEIMGRIEKVE